MIIVSIWRCWSIAWPIRRLWLHGSNHRQEVVCLMHKYRIRVWEKLMILKKEKMIWYQTRYRLEYVLRRLYRVGDMTYNPPYRHSLSNHEIHLLHTEVLLMIIDSELQQWPGLTHVSLASGMRDVRVTKWVIWVWPQLMIFLDIALVGAVAALA